MQNPPHTALCSALFQYKEYTDVKVPESREIEIQYRLNAEQISGLQYSIQLIARRHRN
jgi:hypothetical protein